MKNALKFNLIILCICLSTTKICGQTTITQDAAALETEDPKHELRLNALYLLLGAFEVNYEYLINENSAVGLSGMYTFDDDFWEFKHHITGYYRHYFGKKYAGGFYGEVFAMYNSIEDDYYYFHNGTSYYEDNASHNFGMGFAFGTKLISRKNLLLDVGVGLGRKIYSSGDDAWLVPRFNVSFGYRF